MEKWIRRGDIYYIDRADYPHGSEQRGGRPAIIVSNNLNNRYSPTVEIVYLTTAPKKDLVTHVTIWGTKVKSIALCEQVTTVSKTRIGGYLGACSQREMERIDSAVMLSLGINAPAFVAGQRD